MKACACNALISVRQRRFNSLFCLACHAVLSRLGDLTVAMRSFEKRERDYDALHLNGKITVEEGFKAYLGLLSVRVDQRGLRNGNIQINYTRR